MKLIRLFMGRWSEMLGLGILLAGMLLAVSTPPASGQAVGVDRRSAGVSCSKVVLSSGGAALVVSRTRLIVVDQGRVRIFTLTGSQRGTAIPTIGKVAVAVVGSRVIVADDGRVRIFDLNGSQLGTSITTRDAPSGFLGALSSVKGTP